ncbi:molybdopterin-dependent oxidoreductase, partial [Streptomyces sp. NPDC001848]|uniref:molybdopterin-dependent oxidoreductase n=1 Tax=Streptomyces sp. NPDC001848 TaxID=3364618 RepID=UPI0036ABAC70
AGPATGSTTGVSDPRACSDGRRTTPATASPRPWSASDGELRETDWDTAMDALVTRSRQVIRDHGPLAMAFSTSGQLFAEEYHALAKIARGGIGTPHLDGNTRLCTATAEWALIESFGSDGDPGSYTDIDLCDTLFLVGHNVAETQTVLWARIPDRLGGPDRPRLAGADPRLTLTARRADVHLPVRPGTNVALLNALQHEMIRHGWVDEPWVRAHTVGYDDLVAVAEQYPPERAWPPPTEDRPGRGRQLPFPGGQLPSLRRSGRGR